MSTTAALALAAASAGLLLVIGVTVLAAGVGAPVAAWWTTAPVLVALAFTAGTAPALLMLVGMAIWTATPWLPPAPVGILARDALLVQALGGALIALIAARLGARYGGRVRARLDPALPMSTVGVRAAAFLCFLAAAPLTVLAAVSWTTYREAANEGRELTHNAARLGREHAQRIFEANELVARAIDASVSGAGPEELRERRSELDRLLRTMMADIPPVQSVWLLDADGNVLAGSLDGPTRPVSSRDRDYFTVHLQRNVPWYISEPFVGRTSGQALFGLSTARRDRNGTLHGVVTTAIHPASFTAFYRDLVGANAGLVVSLVRSDGALLATSAPAIDGGALQLPAAVRDALKSRPGTGIIDQRDAGAGTQRVFAYAGMDRYPAAVVASVGEHGILEKQARIVALPALLVCFGSLLLLGAALTALRYYGEQGRLFARFKDLSEARTRAEQAAAEGQKMEALGRLTGGVAHDINNLLSVVANNATLLGALHPEARDSAPLRSISRAVSSSARILSQLVAFTGHRPSDLQQVSPGEVLAGLLNLIRAAVGSGVEVELKDAAPQRRVRVDATEFERAILNLAVNAKDAMPEGGHLTLTVRDATAEELSRSDRHADGAWVVIEAADTGRGMSDDVRQRAFEPFYTTKGRAGGSGLGLSQVYGLCAQAGGFATLRSRPGAGTTVSLFLPCCASVDPLAGTPTDEARFDGLRVLLVEDNVELAEATVSLLDNLGCKVTVEHDAAQALERIERTADQIDVVVSDILMPGSIDGHELAIELRRRFPGLAVVLVTAYAAQATAARKAGFTVLTKPSPLSALAAAIRAARGARSTSAASGGSAASPH